MIDKLMECCTVPLVILAWILAPVTMAISDKADKFDVFVTLVVPFPADWIWAIVVLLS